MIRCVELTVMTKRDMVIWRVCVSSQQSLEVSGLALTVLSKVSEGQYVFVSESLNIHWLQRASALTHAVQVCVCVRVCALLLSDRKPFVSLRLAGVYEWKRINGGHRMKGRTHALKLILIQCIVICKERLWLFHTVRERPCSATQIHWSALSTRQQQCGRKAKQSFLLHFSITETYFFSHFQCVVLIQALFYTICVVSPSEKFGFILEVLPGFHHCVGIWNISYYITMLCVNNSIILSRGGRLPHTE